MIEPNPFETLRQIAAGYCLSRGLHVVANLAIADKLDETPRTAAELAVSVGAHCLRSILRWQVVRLRCWGLASHHDFVRKLVFQRSQRKTRIASVLQQFWLSSPE